MTQQLQFPAVDPLTEERERLVGDRKHNGGTSCAACGQHVQEYRRRLNSTMARALIRLYRAAPDGRFVAVADLRFPHQVGGEFARLALWGLIEEAPRGEDNSKRTSGFWRITSAGVGFVLVQTTEPAGVTLYNGNVLGFSPERVTIAAALGRRFDYGVLMGGVTEVDDA